MRRLAIFVVRRRWWVMIGVIIVLPLLALYGGNVHSKLSSSGYDDPSSDSFRAATAIKKQFPNADQSSFVVLVTAKKGTVDSPEVVAVGKKISDQLAKAHGVTSTASYWILKVPQLRSEDSKQAIVVASLHGDEGEQLETAGVLTPEFTENNDVVATVVTGRSAVTRQISDQAEKDLNRADLFTAPVTFIALIIVFGSLVAAGMPLLVALMAVIGTFAALTLLASFTDVSVFSLNLATGLGLGLAIDYSLFVVSRYREELARGVSTAVAIGRSMQTAGRTVAFSAGTVAISLTALAIFPMPYLRSFAYAGVAVVALAAVASIVILPAFLAILGPRIDKFRLFKAREVEDDGGFWGRQARRVMRRPIPYAVTVTLFLMLLAVPFFHFNPGLADERVGPKNLSSRVAAQEIRQRFASREADAFQIQLPNVDPTTAESKAAIDKFAKAISVEPGVERVDAVTGHYHVRLGKVLIPFAPPDDLSKDLIPPAGQTGTFLNVVPNIAPLSDQGITMIKDIRATNAPFKFLVTGASAQLVDTKDSVLSRLPWALAAIALATFFLLFMMTGSLLVPLKALALNVLSLTATFGAIVWIFQDGHYSGILNFTPTGDIDVFTPILMFCIAFGLSMDYEVFLLSRIKEEYDLEHDNEQAVAIGLQKTGRIVTAAALLLTIVFVGIATSEVSLVKAFGVGLALAVLIDAFLIRATLVPAFMRLAGRLNWWAPKWLRRWHLRFGIWENEPIALLDREFEHTMK
jgi:RND superfamily putative drug exporter